MLDEPRPCRATRNGWSAASPAVQRTYRRSPAVPSSQVGSAGVGVVGGQLLEGSVLDGSVLDGSVLVGPVLDGPVLDGSVEVVAPFPEASSPQPRRVAVRTSTAAV